MTTQPDHRGDPMSDQTINRNQLSDACHALGLNPDDVRAATMTPDAVAVERYLVNDQGRKRLVRRGWLRRRQPATTTDIYRVTDLED